MVEISPQSVYTPEDWRAVAQKEAAFKKNGKEFRRQRRWEIISAWIRNLGVLAVGGAAVWENLTSYSGSESFNGRAMDVGFLAVSALTVGGYWEFWRRRCRDEQDALATDTVNKAAQYPPVDAPTWAIDHVETILTKMA